MQKLWWHIDTPGVAYAHQWINEASIWRVVGPVLASSIYRHNFCNSNESLYVRNVNILDKIHRNKLKLPFKNYVFILTLLTSDFLASQSKQSNSWFKSIFEITNIFNFQHLCTVCIAWVNKINCTMQMDESGKTCLNWNFNLIYVWNVQ